MFSCRNYYKALLGHRKPHIRRFAAESFGYLLRRLKLPAPAPAPASLLTLNAKTKSALAHKENKAGTAAKENEAEAENNDELPKVVPDMANVLELVLALSEEELSSEDYRDGLSALLFHMVKVN